MVIWSFVSRKVENWNCFLKRLLFFPSNIYFRTLNMSYVYLSILMIIYIIFCRYMAFALWHLLCTFFALNMFLLQNLNLEIHMSDYIYEHTYRLFYLLYFIYLWHLHIWQSNVIFSHKIVLSVLNMSLNIHISVYLWACLESILSILFYIYLWHLYIWQYIFLHTKYFFSMI